MQLLVYIKYAGNGLYVSEHPVGTEAEKHAAITIQNTSMFGLLRHGPSESLRCEQE